MDPKDDIRDQRLSRLLRMAQAETDPRLWTRARARIEALERTPRPLAWLVRPAGLAAAFALLVAAVGTSTALLRALPWQQPFEVVTLTDQLIGERSAANAATTPGVAPDPRVPDDSAGVL